MFKKRGRKGRAGEFDKNKFISEEAEQRYEAVVKLKALVPERGFHNPGGHSEEIISKRGWKYFAKQPSVANISLVREFYANAHEHRDFKVFVRGKWIPFSPEVINRIFRLKNIPYDQYSSFCSGDINWDSVIEALCNPDSGVVWRRHDGKPVNFHSGGLTSDAKAWHYFISGKLMPTMNTSEVTRDRALLNYCIFAGLTIDVGSIIHNSILQYIKSTTTVSTSGLGHPALIDSLCNAHGVSGEDNEETLNPRSVLTKEKIGSYTSRFSHHEHGEGSGSYRSPPAKSKPLSISERVGILSEDMRGFQQKQHEFGKRQEKMGRDIGHIKEAIAHTQDQQMSFFEYMGEHNASLTQTLANCNLNIGPRYVDFPDPPTYKFYTFPTEEPDDEKEEEDEYVAEEEEEYSD